LDLYCYLCNPEPITDTKAPPVPEGKRVYCDSCMELIEEAREVLAEIERNPLPAREGPKTPNQIKLGPKSRRKGEWRPMDFDAMTF
jgi:hypothetical protein